MAGEDFVHVRLSAAGRAWVRANGGETLRVAEPGRDLVFSAADDAADVRASRAFEWEKVLRPSVVPGPTPEPFFELAPDARPAPPDPAAAE